MIFGGYNGIVGIISLVLLIWVIYDVVKVQRRMDTGMKVLWIIVALILPIIGAIIYYFIGKK